MRELGDASHAGCDDGVRKTRTMAIRAHNGDLRTFLRADLPEHASGLAWLGQAGFAIRSERCLILIDPYLSDSLAEKYKRREFPHIRLHAPPIAPAELVNVDAVLCTHRHSDHMDPGTIPTIAARNPTCRFVVPRAELESAARLRIPIERTISIDGGETSALADNIQVRAIPSAHESLETNESGQYRFLGYLLRLPEYTIYHSGDCVPYPGLVEHLRNEHIDLALLPINGRDEYRRSHGVPGNMAFEEAVSLCLGAGIPRLVPHHFGMFAFNTIDTADLAHRISQMSTDVEIQLPRLDTWYECSS